MKVVVVTASIQWLVELAVEIYHLPVDCVLGMRTALDGQMISDKIFVHLPLASIKRKFY